MDPLYTQYFSFDSESELERFTEFLKNRPEVRSFDRPQPVDTHGAEITRQTFANANGLTANDGGLSDESRAYYFNRHRIHQAVNFYLSPYANNNGSPTTPKLVVIEKGFNTVSMEDQPNYLTAHARRYNAAGWFLDTTFHKTGNDGQHGRIVATLLAAPRNNSGYGFYGTAPGAHVVPYRVDDPNTTNITQAIYDAAILHPGTVVNISMGLAYDHDDDDETAAIGLPLVMFQDVLNAMTNMTNAYGNMFVISAGNSNQNLDTLPMNPESIGNVVIVGGLSKSDGKRYSAADGSNYGKHIVISASGEDIQYLAEPPFPAGFYFLQDGTSMATPLVAGTLALMKIMAEKTPENVVGWNGISKEEWLRQLIATSGSITNGTSGELMGMWTNNAPTFEGGNSSIRVLNAQNALTIARWRGNNPWVRVFNSDNIGEMNAYSYVWGSPQWNYGNTNYTSTSLSEDVIYGMGGYVANDYVVAFRVNNTAGSYSHGYQLYRFGRIWNENIGGSSRREWPNATLIHDTIGEDAGNTTTGYRRAYQTNAL